ncbi:MAG: hypothetical protein Kow00129_06050 [Thermoleophilia bacterium]
MNIGSRAGCPQCGASVVVPRERRFFVCPWCGSILSPSGGPRAYELWQRVTLDASAAESSVRRWLAGPELPRRAERKALLQVQPMRWVAFLRIRRDGPDVVEPLGEIRAAEAVELSALPAVWLPEGERPDRRPEEPARRQEEATEVQEALARLPELDSTVSEVLIEHRAYYPVEYVYEGRPFSAVVDAGTGIVVAARLPAVEEFAGSGYLAVATAGILFAGAVLLPGGLAVRLGFVVVTALVLYVAGWRGVLER